MLKSRYLFSTAGVLVTGYVFSLGGGGIDAADVQGKADAAEPASVEFRVGPDYAGTLAGVREAYDAILINVANAGTPGYRALRPTFEAPPDASPLAGDTALHPVIRRDPSPGRPVHTGRWLDVAIDGPGYFVLDDPASRSDDALAYCRDGRLFINPHNELVYGHPDGPRLEPIVVFPDDYRDLRITRAGRIDVLSTGDHGWVPVGQLHLARFANDTALQRRDTGRLTATAESGPPRVAEPGHLGLGTLKQKHLEGSNVDLAAELAELEHLKQWGTSLAAALGVEPGFPQLPAVDLQHIAGPPADAPYPYSRPAPRTRLSAGR